MTTQGELPDIVERLSSQIAECDHAGSHYDKQVATILRAAKTEITRLRATPPGSPLIAERDLAGVLANAIFSENLDEMPVNRDEFGPSWCQQDMLDAAKEILSAGFEVRKRPPFPPQVQQSARGSEG